MALNGYFERVAEAASFLRKEGCGKPQLVLVLSGGLNFPVEAFKECVIVKGEQIPNFPLAKAEGHSGVLIFGKWNNFPLVVLKGRYHYYEGHSPQDVVFPYFVLSELGAKFLVTTNAVGGIRTDLKPGDMLIIEDHINMMGTSPLIGLTVQTSKDQFPSMQKAYDPELIALAEKIAKNQKLKLKKGVFAGVPGPNYETPAEIRAFRKLGVDCVGMSTVLEVIASRYLKMRVLTLSIIANVAADRHKGEMKHAEVLQAMKTAEKKVGKLLQGVVNAIATQKVPGTFGKVPGTF
ncbi:MAG: purine-nucleoside phosphorylase [Deltaproteobacteria bacterium RIFCSPLOWO2_01_44_7]|nr:MAG: purine-nucleoside phosphorylase [Deltaproteobacteria bacterium RIFCSPHIGHO2_01_FULL_43_49]OGQ16394.1 MAG: purine-nucleoside phosphorylase [Deltaproteobacteria bacterium RIFCSPHIGHO2_02_FULL_44_53]OGQ27780.1 MAG: purine-nucleoside phosphorylase [Deltaproteobacteria bacterium RIFCSPHIGHO2_12_FULL_44_21]OGQ32912.1 MAG: purine-nucleoside phosphorylase [Deltaproteobacteria bacterium RIFCSPLOWO2_01_FULL_45_74]OGQ41647.1 MAG: purine-nucleoside phosphorylase [Deltaproteobacteria bacterium RIFCS